MTCLVGALVAGILVAASACTSGSTPPARRPGGASSAAASAGACRVDVPARWTAAVRAGSVSTRAGERVIVRATGAGGRDQFVELTRPGWRGLVWLRDGGRSRTEIMAVADPRLEQVVAAAFDGRWLVFGVGHRVDQPDDWTLYSWDSVAGGAPQAIAHNTEHAPWLAPAVRDGRAAWIAGVPGMRAQVHLYDLGRRAGRVVHDGPANAVFFLSDLVVWRAGFDDATAPLGAANAATGSPAPLPAQLRTVRSGRYATASDTTVVWTTPDQRTIQAWRAGWAAPRRVVTIPDHVVEWPKVSGDLVTWGDTLAHYVADLRSDSYIQITPSYGWTDAWTDALLVQYEAESNTTGASAVVRTSTLPALPRCR